MSSTPATPASANRQVTINKPAAKGTPNKIAAPSMNERNAWSNSSCPTRSNCTGNNSCAMPVSAASASAPTSPDHHPPKVPAPVQVQRPGPRKSMGASNGRPTPAPSDPRITVPGARCTVLPTVRKSPSITAVAARAPPPPTTVRSPVTVPPISNRLPTVSRSPSTTAPGSSTTMPPNTNSDPLRSPARTTRVRPKTNSAPAPSPSAAAATGAVASHIAKTTTTRTKLRCIIARLAMLPCRQRLPKLPPFVILPFPCTSQLKV